MLCCSNILFMLSAVWFLAINVYYYYYYYYYKTNSAEDWYPQGFGARNCGSETLTFLTEKWHSNMYLLKNMTLQSSAMLAKPSPDCDAEYCQAPEQASSKPKGFHRPHNLISSYLNKPKGGSAIITILKWCRVWPLLHLMRQFLQFFSRW